MKRRIVALYIASIVALGVVAAYRWRDAVPAVNDESFIMPSAPSIRSDEKDSVLASLETMVVANDPFRLANAPSSVPYDPSADGMPAGAAGSVQSLRPPLALKAIVGGPPWQAIVDGIPGQPAGTIVLGGMTFGKFAIRIVARDSVVIQGPDTTWVLSFRRSS